MKRYRKSGLVGILTLATIATGLVAEAHAAAPAKAPVVYDQSRAIPARHGRMVKITVFVKDARGVRVAVGDGARMKAREIGPACGERVRCDRWRLLAPRGEEECYQIEVLARNLSKSGRIRLTSEDQTVCEPFRGGSV